MAAFKAGREETEMFRRDFLPLLMICRKLFKGDRSEFLHKQHLALLNAYADAFSKKYRTLWVKIEKDQYDLPKPVLLLHDEKDFYNVFLVVRQFIPGIKSIELLSDSGIKIFPLSSFKEAVRQHGKELLKGRLCFSYAHKEVSRRVILKYRPEYGMIQMFDTDFMFEEDDPEFMICMHYAFDKGCDSSVDLSGFSDRFSSRVQSEPAAVKGSLGSKPGSDVW